MTQVSKFRYHLPTTTLPSPVVCRYAFWRRVSILNSGHSADLEFGHGVWDILYRYLFFSPVHTKWKWFSFLEHVHVPGFTSSHKPIPIKMIFLLVSDQRLYYKKRIYISAWWCECHIDRETSTSTLSGQGCH